MNSNARDGLRLVSSPPTAGLNCTELSLSGRKLRVPTIQSIEGLRDYRSLKSLDLSLNNISRISGLDSLLHLTTLNLSQNFITTLENLKTLTLLQTLDLSDNRIQKLPKSELSPLVSLRTLLLPRNRLEDLQEIGQLATLPALLTVYIEGNPVSNARDLLLFVAFHLPSVKQLDSTVITTGHKQNALKKYSTRKIDVYLIRENLISYRKQISDLQETKQDLLDQSLLVQAQLSALEADFKCVSDALHRCKEERKDVERMMACTPGDQLHSKKTEMMEAISHAEICREDAELLSRKLQAAKTDVSTKENQLETVRKRLRNRTGVAPSDDFLSSEELQLVTELKQSRMAVQALSRDHSQKLTEMQHTMTRINGLDREIEGVKDGTIAWERTFDEETARYLPVRLTELEREIGDLTGKTEQITAKNGLILKQKNEIDLKLERTENALLEIKEKVRDSEIYVETGKSPEKDRFPAKNYVSDELKAWEALKSLWNLVSDAEMEINYGSLPVTLVKWSDCFLKEWDRKEKEQEINISTVRRIAEAQNSCLRTEMMEIQRELEHFKQENLAISALETTVKALETQISTANNTISNLNGEISALKDTIRLKDEKIEQISHKELVLDQMNEKLLENIEEMTEINENLTFELENYDREPIKKEIKALKEECDRLHFAVFQSNSEYSEITRKQKEKQTQLEEIDGELTEKAGKLQEIEENLGLYLTLKQRKDENSRAEAAINAVATALSLEIEPISSLTVKISNKIQEITENTAKFHQFQQNQREFADLYERKFTQLKTAREKLSAEQLSFRKTQKTLVEKMQNDKSAFDRVCKSMKIQSNQLSDEIEAKKDELTALNHKIATVRRMATQMKVEGRTNGRITSRELQAQAATDRSFVVLRSSPDLGFISPLPKSHKKTTSSYQSCNRCPTDEDRCSSIQTDRMYRGSPKREVSRCETVRMGEESRLVTQGSDRGGKTESVLKIEEELEALKAQLERFAVDSDPLPRQQTI